MTVVYILGLPRDLTPATSCVITLHSVMSDMSHRVLQFVRFNVVQQLSSCSSQLTDLYTSV